ncbi:hypothetical protein [Hazenella coriacea]|uniref:Uncharacterized protein n=1 Tax=Hazenella coriacea TaxID=1179467 RepID=A0A4R3L730_9BACL|nr:hypothetical protein [Hazenella coriacea]TCS94835.1 hypothetical protein EDD58_103257 [Hazenella coriacea]
MDFRIQAGAPRVTGQFDEEDENLAEAIETIFPLYTEDAILVWKNIYIPLSYKYEISIMTWDLLDMLEKLRKHSSGEWKIQWASDSFRNSWYLRWEEDTLTINAEWGSVIGNTENQLKEKREIKVPILAFTAEWRKLLGNLITGLQKSGYTEERLPGMDRLIHEYHTIPFDGILYAKPHHQ